MNSACPEDFKTDLTFDIWPSRTWENWHSRHQGSFSAFTFSGPLKSLFWEIIFKDRKSSIKPGSIMWKISEKVMLEVKTRFWRSRRVVTTAETEYYIPYSFENWKWPMVSLTSIFSGKELKKSTLSIFSFKSVSRITNVHLSSIAKMTDLTA